MPLRLWFKAMFLMAAQKSGLSAKTLQLLMGFGSYQTAWSCGCTSSARRGCVLAARS